MSYIDSFHHTLVGYFAGLPVYRPTVDIPYPDEGTSDEDFGCDRNQIVIGGGSGEHPGLVLERPGAAMAKFALSSELFNLSNEVASELEHLIEKAPIHQRYGWLPDQVDAFESLCQSPALCNPFDPNRSSIEDWLTLGFGEFAYISMPDLDTEMVAKLKMLEAGEHSSMEFNNILLPPPFMPTYASGGVAFKCQILSEGWDNTLS
ncbi:hypothetical protein NHF45_12850 [Maricaulaceae bacterium NA33B04]|nr:hypothetical protein [Maricaulaceae bacterium NA33B04]